MKKIIMALVCATMSLSLMAQPNDKKDNNRQPRMEQAGPQQGCPMAGPQQGCPMAGPQQCFPMMAQKQQTGDVAILKQIGVDSTKIKQVKDLKKKQREALQNLKEQYRKDLRQILGDETYIKYLETKCDKQQKAPKRMQRKGMQRKGQQRMGQRGNGRMGQQGMQPGQPQPRKDGAQKSGDKKDKKGGKDKKNKKERKLNQSQQDKK